MVGIYLLYFHIFVVCRAFLVPDGLDTVSSPVGDIVGYVSNVNVNSKQHRIRNYLGIPYAEPPTGNTRFAKPVPKARFSSPFDAKKEGPICYQTRNILFPIPPEYTVSEDCLVLNIYAPEITNSNGVNGNGAPAYPVMIFIHGGGFVIGYSNLYNGQMVSASGDVIVVTINYRLAELGFLTTGDSSAPGNMGLWDQHLAIRWVHDNIQAFGGDPTRVTIFGESAGSASVVYQTMYPGNKGLFQRAIAESGSISSSWAYKEITEAKNSSKAFSALIGCNQISSNEIMRCLRSKTALEINATINGASSGEALLRSWPPVVDNDFLLDKPSNLLSGQSQAKEAVDMFNSIDLIIGVNSRDGLVNLPAWTGMLNVTDMLGVSRNDFEDILVPYYVQFATGYKDVPDIAVKAAVFEYTDWSDPNNDIKRIEKIVELSTDTIFSVTSILTANLHSISPNTSTYMYKFSTSPPQHLLSVPAFIDGPEVANHGDELAFIFGWIQRANVTIDPKLEMVQEAIITMWTNFAKTGNPNKPVDVSAITNTNWPEYGSLENYLNITPDMTSQSVKQRIAPRAVAFWEHIIPELLKSNGEPHA